MSNHLIIGLGGTGGSILRSLRKQIYNEYHSNIPQGNVHIEYLYVDSDLTDLNNERDWYTSGISVQLPYSQRLFINDINIDENFLNKLDRYSNIKAFISNKDKETLKKEIGNRFIGYANTSLKDKNRQCRRIGRMRIAYNMCGLPQNTFVGRIHSCVKALQEKEYIDDVTFHICAGLGGKTGSSFLIDAIAQIRNEFQRTRDDRTKFKILLYLYVPEKIIQIPGGEDSNHYYQPNGYAALLELNAMSVGCYYPTDVKGNTDKYGNVRRLLEGQDAFDMAYLYSSINEADQETSINRVLPYRIGDFLFQTIVNSSIRNMGISNIMERIDLLPEMNEITEPVHSRRFIAPGILRIEYPETEIVEYGAYRFAHQALTQMLYNRWDNDCGYIECTEDMVGKSYVQAVDKEIETNLLTDDYLMLSKPLPSIEKHATTWKPIIQGWEYYIDHCKQDVQTKCQKKEWYEEFNKRCEDFFDSIYREIGVKKFYFDYESQIPGFAEEICRRIEKNLFAKWGKGEMSIIEVHKYINILISKCNERIEEYKDKITKLSTYLNEDLTDLLENIRIDWNNISRLKDAFTDVSTKTFGRFADAKREQLTVTTTIYAYRYATKLSLEVANMLTLLNVNSIEPFIKVLNDSADTLKGLAEEKCKLSDAETSSTNGYVMKIYDPQLIRDKVGTFLKNKESQKKHADDLRESIIKSTGTSVTTFSSFSKEIHPQFLQEITIKYCIENAREEMYDYSIRNASQRLINVNILNKLHKTICNTPDKRKCFVKEIYNAAQSFLSFNKLEDRNSIPEAAIYCMKFFQILLPPYEEDNTFREDFIKDLSEIYALPFNKCDNVSVNPKHNQIVLINAYCGFPLRYVDNVKVLKEKYNLLAKNEVSRMMMHTESFSHPLPDLFYPSSEEIEKELMPIILLAYTIDGIIVEREDMETGEKIKAFACEKNKMGRIHRWIKVEKDMVATLKELSNKNRAIDTAILKKAIMEKLHTNYKHIEERELLIKKLKETLDNELPPLAEDGKYNPTVAAFYSSASTLRNNLIRSTPPIP